MWMAHPVGLVREKHTVMSRRLSSAAINFKDHDQFTCELTSGKIPGKTLYIDLYRLVNM